MCPSREPVPADLGRGCPVVGPLKSLRHPEQAQSAFRQRTSGPREGGTDRYTSPLPSRCLLGRWEQTIVAFWLRRNPHIQNSHGPARRAWLGEYLPPLGWPSHDPPARHSDNSRKSVDAWLDKSLPSTFEWPLIGLPAVLATEKAPLTNHRSFVRRSLAASPVLEPVDTARSGRAIQIHTSTGNRDYVSLEPAPEPSIGLFGRALRIAFSVSPLVVLLALQRSSSTTKHCAVTTGIVGGPVRRRSTTR